MEPDDWGMPRRIVDGQDIKAARPPANVAFGQKVVRRANEQMLLSGSDAKLGQSSRTVVAHSPRSDFDEGQYRSVVAHEIDFAFCTAGRVIAGHENVAMAAEIPVSEGFAADAGLPSFVLFGFRGRIGVFGVFAQTFAGRPAHRLED